MSEQKVTAFSFNSAGIDPMRPNEPIPAGWYPVEITDAEIRPTGKGRAAKGKGLFFNFKVLNGDYKGRMIFGSCINVENASAQAQEIGQRELATICHATNLPNFNDLREFFGRQLEVQVKIQPAEGNYEARNEVKGYKALEGAAAPAAFVPQTPAAAPVAPAVPAAPPVAPPAPAPVAAPEFPPAGWLAHPSAPGFFYCGNDVKSEADLRASLAPVVPVAPPAPVAPPFPPAVPGIPAVPTSAAPPWGVPQA